MSLPDWTEAGLLPPGCHPASLSDIYDRFVIDAPVSGRDQRELIFAALSLHLRLVQRVIPVGRAWIDGSFATRSELPPNDVDVAVLPSDWELLERLPVEDRIRLYSLITLKDVAAMEPAIVLSKLQPVSGLVDAFLVRPDQEATWDEQWSRVMGPDRRVLPDQKKGYAEVTW
jgi:hypothetical protein